MFGRRQDQTPNNTIFLNDTAEDLGLAFNTLASLDTFPDFVRTDNVTGTRLDVYGGFTVTAWVKVTARTAGFLFAKVDSVFLADGRSPALERAFIDIQDRDIPEFELQSYQSEDSVSTHVAVYLDGPNKRVSLLVSDKSRRFNAKTREDWHYVRHFRLGESQLYDGEWKFFAIRLYSRNERQEGQVFVDGFSQIADPNYIQCLPFMPPLIINRNHTTTGLDGIGFNSPGSSTIWGYRLKGSLDELHVYNEALNPQTLPEIAGIREIRRITKAVLITLVTLSAVVAFIYVVVTVMGVGAILKDHFKSDDSPPRDRNEESAVADLESKQKAAEKQAETEGTDDALAAVGPAAANGSSNPLVTSTRLRESDVQIEIQPLDGSADEHVDEEEESSDDDDSEEGEEERPGEAGDARNADQAEFSSPQSPQSPEAATGMKFPSKDSDDVPRTSAAWSADGDADAAPGKKRKMSLTEMKYLPKSVRRRQHLALLERIKALTEKAEEDQLKKEGKTKSDKGAPIVMTSADVSSITTTSSSSWQITSELASGMELPDVWMASFAGFSHFIALDFTPGLGGLYTGVFIFVVTLAALLFLMLVVINLCSKVKTKRQVVKELEAVEAERRECLQKDKPYDPKRPFTFRITLLVATLMSFIYMPVTNQSLAVVFCHPNIFCIYDCYNDATHQTLVVIGAFALLFITLGVPFLYALIIHRTAVQYHTFLGTYDVNLQKEHWASFATIVANPFSSLYENLTHTSKYFQPLSLLFRTLITAAIVALPSESAPQLIVCMSLQLLFAIVSLYFKPFQRLLVNISLGVSQLYIVVMLMLRAIQLLAPERSAVGTTMVVLSSIALVLQLILTAIALKATVVAFLHDRKKAKRLKEIAEQEEEEKNRKAESPIDSEEGKLLLSGENGGAEAPNHENQQQEQTAVAIPSETSETDELAFEVDTAKQNVAEEAPEQEKRNEGRAATPAEERNVDDRHSEST